MLVEVIDKFRVSQMRVGKISEVIGGRLRINYENVCEIFGSFFLETLLNVIYIFYSRLVNIFGFIIHQN